MTPSDANPDQSGEIGTPHFNGEDPITLRPLNDEELAHRDKLKRAREVVTQMFHFMDEPMPFLQEDPDKWILAIMERLRPAAQNLMEPDIFRTALLKAGAAVVASIIEMDDLCRQNGFILPK